jgi:hypothetical protein
MIHNSKPLLQSAICPQILAVRILEQLLPLPVATSIATKDVWMQLLSSWSALKRDCLYTSRQPEELQCASSHTRKRALNNSEFPDCGDCVSFQMTRSCVHCAGSVQILQL